MKNILACITALLSLPGCVSIKDRSDHKVTTLTYKNEDADSLSVADDERFSLSSMRVEKDFTASSPDKSVPAPINATGYKAAKYAAEREANQNNQVDPRTPRIKSRHEKMLQQTSPVFADPTDSGLLHLKMHNIKK